MRCNEPQSFSFLVRQTTGLSQIEERTSALFQLSRALDEILSKPLNEKCRVANYRQGILVIEVSSASWLTRLKYEQSNVLSALRQKVLPALSSIQYQINPDLGCYSHQNSHPLPLNATKSSTITPQSALYLYELAERAPEKLKKQLIKLANHAK
ncbi:DciA family protein [Orbaceae bacterium ESL0727]|nr:DciA family protein [Orbaceae bacterium ESL0727]